jgi:hypothetical protein
MTNSLTYQRATPNPLAPHETESKYGAERSPTDFVHPLELIEFIMTLVQCLSWMSNPMADTGSGELKGRPAEGRRICQ